MSFREGKGGKPMYSLSKYWNRLAYLVIRIGRMMIWDQTGYNGEILGNDDFASKTTAAILCNR